MEHKRSLYGVIAASPFVQTYYALHCILIFSWILVRIPLAQSGSVKIASTLTYWVFSSLKARCVLPWIIVANVNLFLVG